MSKTKQLGALPKPEKSTLDKSVVLTVQQLFTYAAILVTIGASVYTFFKAIPKIDKLDDSVVQLQISNTRVEERIQSLRDILSERRIVIDTIK